LHSGNRNHCKSFVDLEKIYLIKREPGFGYRFVTSNFASSIFSKSKSAGNGKSKSPHLNKRAQIC